MAWSFTYNSAGTVLLNNTLFFQEVYYSRLRLLFHFPQKQVCTIFRPLSKRLLPGTLRHFLRATSQNYAIQCFTLFSTPPPLPNGSAPSIFHAIYSSILPCNNEPTKSFFLLNIPGSLICHYFKNSSTQLLDPSMQSPDILPWNG